MIRNENEPRVLAWVRRGFWLFLFLCLATAVLVPWWPWVLGTFALLAFWARRTVRSETTLIKSPTKKLVLQYERTNVDQIGCAAYIAIITFTLISFVISFVNENYIVVVSCVVIWLIGFAFPFSRKKHSLKIMKKGKVLAKFIFWEHWVDGSGSDLDLIWLPSEKGFLINWIADISQRLIIVKIDEKLDKKFLWGASLSLCENCRFFFPDSEEARSLVKESLGDLDKLNKPYSNKLKIFLQNYFSTYSCEEECETMFVAWFKMIGDEEGASWKMNEPGVVCEAKFKRRFQPRKKRECWITNSD